MSEPHAAGPDGSGSGTRGHGPSIAGYRDLTPLGQGGFATVYRAYQEQFDRVVAVKVITIDVDDRTRDRFIRECQAAGRLSGHPNVVTVLDAGVTEQDRPYMTTELMERGSIADWIDRNGPMPLADALQVGVKMCGALSVVHAAGILHRDVKPQNILVSGYGEPALADFGISAVGMGTSGARATMTFTPEYTPPEILEGRAPEPTMDVYSLGATIYALISGNPPFVSRDDEGLLPFIRRLMDDPVPPLDPALAPAEVVAVLAVAMAKDGGDRFPTAEAFGQRLQELQAALGQPVTPMLTQPATGTDDPTAGIEALLRSSTTNVISPTAAVGAPAPRGRAPWVVAAAAVVVALVAGLVLVTRSNDGTGVASGPSGPTATGASAGSGTVGADGRAVPNPAAPVDGGHLTIALRDDVGGLNPSIAGFNPSSYALLSAITDPLVRVSDGKVQLVLAESLEPNADATEWRIRLRPGVTFHDGTVLDAPAVVASLEAIRGNPIAGTLLGPVAALQADGDRTVVVRMRRSWGAFPGLLAQGFGFVFKAAPKGADGREGLIGTGPFQVTQGLKDGTVELGRYDGYWGPRPHLDAITFRVLPSEEERVAAIETGAVDVVFTSDTSTLGRLGPKFPVVEQQDAFVDYLVLNTDEPPFDNPLVRDALVLATDRDALVAASGPGSTVLTAADAFAPFAEPTPNPKAFDLARAKALLAESGLRGNDLAFQLGSVVNQRSARLTTPLKRMWTEAGFTVDNRAVEADVLRKAQIGGTAQASLAELALPPDPDLFYVYLHSSSVGPRQQFGLNLSRLKDDTIDAALEQGRASTDEATRRQAYTALAARLDETSSYIFLVNEPYALVASRSVTGLRADLATDLVRGGTAEWITQIGVQR